MKRRWLVLLLVVALLGGLSAILYVRCRPLAFTQELAERLKPGMSLAEVERTLGVPAGNYAGPETTWIGSGPMMWWLKPEGWTNERGETWRAWISDAGSILVMFDAKDRVAWASFGSVFTPSSDSLWETVRSSLRRILQLGPAEPRKLIPLD